MEEERFENTALEEAMRRMCPTPAEERAFFVQTQHYYVQMLQRSHKENPPRK